MRLGAHVAGGGPLAGVVDRARALGCECLQIFVGNPRQWRTPERRPEELAELGRLRLAAGLEPLVAHAPYLIQLATTDAAMRARVVTSLADSLRAMEQAGGLGVVTHAGSARGAETAPALERAAATLREALDRAGGARLLLENSAGATLCGTFEELRDVLALLDGDPRVGVCLDSAHLFAAGWDLRHAEGVDRALTEFDRVVGLPRLWLFHLNDSLLPLGSRRDRHENIGEGQIGREGFRALLADPRLAGLGGVIETPGFDRKGPDARNLAILRELRDGPPARRRGKVRR